MTDKPDHKDTGLVPTTDKTLTTRSSALVRRGLNAVESLDSFDPGLEGGHNLGMASQSEGKTQSTGERLDAYLEEKGAVRKVGPDYYADFENLNDEQMRALIALVIAASEKELNRMLLDEEKRYTDPDLLKHIESKLWAISRGWLSLVSVAKRQKIPRLGYRRAPGR